jgi:hypothetical protein
MAVARPAVQPVADYPGIPTVPVLPAGLPSDLLERRPDVAAAERAVAASSAQIGAAEAAYYPSLSLSASAGLRSSSFSELLRAPAWSWSPALSVLQVLFDAGQRKAVTAQARAAHESQVAAYRQTVLQSFKEVEDNLAALRILEEEIGLQVETLAAARLALQLVTNQYQAGVVNYLGVLTAQTSALNTERSLLDLRGRRLTASVGLIRQWAAAGRGLKPTEQDGRQGYRVARGAEGGRRQQAPGKVSSSTNRRSRLRFAPAARNPSPGARGGLRALATITSPQTWLPPHDRLLRTHPGAGRLLAHGPAAGSAADQVCARRSLPDLRRCYREDAARHRGQATRQRHGRHGPARWGDRGAERFLCELQRQQSVHPAGGRRRRLPGRTGRSLARLAPLAGADRRQLRRLSTRLFRRADDRRRRQRRLPPSGNLCDRRPCHRRAGCGRWRGRRRWRRLSAPYGGVTHPEPFAAAFAGAFAAACTAACAGAFTRPCAFTGDFTGAFTGDFTGPCAFADPFAAALAGPSPPPSFNPPVPDTVAAITAVTDNAAPRTGTVANGAATNDNTPTITGSLSAPLAPGESVQVLRNGAPLAGPVIVAGNSWQLTDTPIPDGAYTYTARTLDSQGAGASGAGYRIVVDTVNNRTASIESVTDNVTPNIGFVRDGGTTNDPTPTLAGGLSGPLAPGEELQILRDGAVVGRPSQTSGTTWSFTDSLPGNGDYDYIVRVVDAAGNIGRESAVYDVQLDLRRGNSGGNGRDDDDGDPRGIRGEQSVQPDDTIGALALGDLLDSGATASPPASSATLAAGANVLSMPPGSDSLDQLLAS